MSPKEVMHDIIQEGVMYNIMYDILSQCMRVATPAKNQTEAINLTRKLVEGNNGFSTEDVTDKLKELGVDPKVVGMVADFETNPQRVIGAARAYSIRREHEIELRRDDACGRSVFGNPPSERYLY